MNIDNDLILKWEPKIQKLLAGTFVIGMEREDIAQELRISIIKAAQHFDDTKGTSFHTYLHTVMMNTIRTFISKAQKYDNINQENLFSGKDIFKLAYPGKNTVGKLFIN